MALSVEDILKAIDNMDIYKKDYDIIQSLLETGDNKLFTKIVEEVLLGNLYWSDFDKNMAHTNYPSVLRKQLKGQQEINDELDKLITLRSTVDGLNEEFSNKTSSLAIKEYYSDDEDEQKIQEFYQEEMEKIRGNILYELTRANDKDTVITSAFKTRLYNAIKNGELVLKAKAGQFTPPAGMEITETEILIHETTDYTAVAVPDPFDLWKYYEYDSSSKKYSLTSDFEIDKNKKYYLATQQKHEYINPDDIFLFINSYAIPIDIKYQVLDEFDYIYMRQNGVEEDKMKQIKAVSLLLRRDKRLNDDNGGVS